MPSATTRGSIAGVSRSWAREPVVLFGLLLSVLLLVPYAVPFLNPTQLDYYSGLYDDAPLILLVLLVLVRRSLVAHSRESQFWRLLTLAWGTWLVIRLANILVSEAIYWDVRFSLFIDLLYVAFYLFHLFAIECRPDEPAPRDVGVRLRQLQALGALVFAFGLLTYFAVIPGALQPDAYDTFVPSMYLYLVLDLYLLWRWFGLTRTSRDHTWSLTYRGFLLTACLFLIADLREVLAYSGSPILQEQSLAYSALGYCPYLATLVVVVRSRRQLGQALDAVAGNVAGPRLAQASGTLVVFLLAFPLLHLGGYSSGLLDPFTRPAREACALAFFVALAVLTYLYQRRLTAENRALAREHAAISERLELTQRMDAVGRLAGGIAHDFNNLLQVIGGYCELLSQSLRSQPGPAETVREIQQATRSAQALTAQVLTLQRGQWPSATHLHLHDTLERLRPMLEQALGPQIQLELSCDAAGDRVGVDDSLLERAVLNLALNARDAMPEGGRFSLRTQQLECSDDFQRLHPGAGAGRYLLLQASDNGEGMDESTRRHLFEPFFTTKRSRGGTGLGLSTVYGMVRQCGGQIEVQSAPHEGTVFSLYLPAAESTTDAVAGQDRIASSSASGTILVVDDQEAVRQSVRLLLEGSGFEVQSAAGGFEALGLIDREPFGLLLTDVVMPGMNGLELAAEARRRQPELPVLLMTAHPGHVDLSAAQQEFVWIEKPFSGEQLQHKIHQALPFSSRTTTPPAVSSRRRWTPG